MRTNMITCPDTGNPISTGIETDRATRDQVPIGSDQDAIAARCRELALECLHLLPVTDEKQKLVLLELAEYWTSLAEKAERGERIDGEISLAPIAEQPKRQT